MRRRVLIAAIAAASVIGGRALAQHDHHGHEAAPAPATGEVLFTADDLSFLQHMIVHHRQALDMSALMEGRTDRAAFLRFGGYVADAQAAEIGAMQGLLDIAAARGLRIPTFASHGDPPMAGMLSSAQMEALAAAKGPEFERLWLEGMIAHHQGGLDMARVQELRQARQGRQPYGVQTLVDDILVVQRAEITRMRDWLKAWGLEKAARD